MQPGSFYCFVPKKGAVSGWLPFNKTSQRGVFRKLNALLAKESDEVACLDESDLFHCTSHNPVQDILSLIYPGAGVAIRLGDHKLNSHISRKEPNVCQTEKAFIVLHGYISNLEDLCLHMGRSDPLKDALLETESNDEWSIGDATSRVLLHLYMNEKGKDPLLVLSELQGQYAFVIYDAEEKIVFSARDASGQESLFYSLDPEKGVSISNVELPDVEETWSAVPPGYYLYGRYPQLLQFALTPDECLQRWSLDLDSETELYSSLDSDHDSRRHWSVALVESLRKSMLSSRESNPQPL